MYQETLLADVHQPNDQKKSVTTEILNKKNCYVHFNDLFYKKQQQQLKKQQP